MDKVLQTGLTSGMSSTAGWHASKPKAVTRELDGKNILPKSFCPDTKSRVSFPAPKDTVQASYICIGAWPWGDRSTFHWSEDQLPEVKQAWKTLYNAGINFIDTAEAYGDGRSEEIIGELVADLPRENVIIQTKYLGAPFRLKDYIHPVESPVQSLKESLLRLKLDFVDVYLVHGHIHPQSIANVAKGMAHCVEQGLARAVGVANYSTNDMLQFRDELAKHNIPLATNQCEFSVLRRYPEVTGEIAACSKNNIIFQSYSSLAQGRLTGKYTAENPPPKTYRFSEYDMTEVEPTIELLRRIGSKRGKSIASVALNYNLSKGALPVVGIRNVEQAQAAIEALGWRLDEDEVMEIDKVSFKGEKTILWQQG